MVPFAGGLPGSQGTTVQTLRTAHSALSSAFLFLRQPSRSSAPRLPAHSGRAAVAHSTQRSKLSDVGERGPIPLPRLIMDAPLGPTGTHTWGRIFCKRMAPRRSERGRPVYRFTRHELPESCPGPGQGLHQTARGGVEPSYRLLVTIAANACGPARSPGFAQAAHVG